MISAKMNDLLNQQITKESLSPPPVAPAVELCQPRPTGSWFGVLAPYAVGRLIGVGALRQS